MGIATKAGRMSWGDYSAVYAGQTLAALGDTRPAPKGWIDLLERFKDQRTVIDSAADAAHELFGECPVKETGEQLYHVEELTQKEGAIAVRMALTHSEKIELVKPLREKRRADADAREARPYRPSKWEREYRENERHRAAEEAALSAEEGEWQRRNRESVDAWLDSLTAPLVETVDETEDRYGDLPSGHSTPVAPVVPVDVAERPFDEHLTDTGRIHAHGMGIRLD